MKVLSELSNAVLMRHITKEEESVCVGVCVRVHVGLVFLHRMMFPSMRACVRACVRAWRAWVCDLARLRTIFSRVRFVGKPKGLTAHLSRC